MKNAPYRGVSMGKTHGGSIHAEMDLLCNVNRDRNFNKHGKYNLVVFRINKNGKYDNAQPCIECAAAIASKPFIRRVIYTDSNGALQTVPHSRVLSIANRLYAHRVVDSHNETPMKTRTKILSRRRHTIPQKKRERISWLSFYNKLQCKPTKNTINGEFSSCHRLYSQFVFGFLFFCSTLQFKTQPTWSVMIFKTNKQKMKFVCCVYMFLCRKWSHVSLLLKRLWDWNPTNVLLHVYIRGHSSARLEHLSYEQRVAGSSPAVHTHLNTITRSIFFLQEKIL